MKVHTNNNFKGACTEIRGKVFIKGPTQAANYDEAYKALMNYFGTKYNQRVYCAFEQKNAGAGRNLLTKPSVPMIDKVVQVAILDSDRKLIGH